MKFLVTGGCGFIGSNLVEHLVKSGHQVLVLDNLLSGKRENIPEQAELIVGSVTDDILVQSLMKQVDGCFHLAAIPSVELSRHNWLTTNSVNLGGAITVFEAAAKSPSRPPVVYASSAAVYGDNPDLPLSEDSETRPVNAYGADKLACELHGEIAGSVHGVSTFGLRFFNVYGPKQDPSSPYSGVISIFAEKLGQGREITIFGDGGQSRDFIYVKDVVQFLVKAMDYSLSNPRTAKVANVCTGKSVTISQLAAIMSEVLGKRTRINFAPARIGDIKTSLGNPALARKLFGYEASFSLAEGLTATFCKKRQAAPSDWRGATPPPPSDSPRPIA